MRVLAFAASLRRGSLNRRLIELAAQIARDEGCTVDLAHFGEFSMPLYDGEYQERHGLPEGAVELQRRLEASDAVMISSPEYNYSIPGTLKNAIDWVSRARPIPWRGRSVYLLSAAPSPMGGIRGLWQTRIPLEGCGALVFPDMFALAHANLAFEESGRLRDPVLQQRLEREIRGFLKLVDAYGGLWTDPGPEARERRRQIAAALDEQEDVQDSPNPSA